MRLVRKGPACGSPSSDPALFPLRSFVPLPFPPHTAPSLQDFVLLKERTLDEAPRPPKKAMDYSSSSEEVESSEDDEEESNGEPSEGSRDAPGARYGGDLGVGTLPHQRHPERRVAGVGEGSGVSVRESGSSFPRGGNPGCHVGQFFPFSKDGVQDLVFLSLPLSF